MSVRNRVSLSAKIAAVTLVAAAALLWPTAAEAQARGTVQVYAQVVDAKASYDALQAAHALTRDFAAAPTEHRDAVSTLAHVSVAYQTERRSGLVVTIDYAKN